MCGSKKQGDRQIETLVRYMINPWRQNEEEGQRSVRLAVAALQRLH